MAQPISVWLRDWRAGLFCPRYYRSPSTSTEANAASIARWEFTDSDDADLGYSFSKPSLVRLANGKWGVIVGNGLNSTEADGNASSTGNAVIFILDAETGAVIKKLDTKQGTADDPKDCLGPMALSAPVVVDEDGDFIADRLYAGDFLAMFGPLIYLDSNHQSMGLRLWSQANNPSHSLVPKPSLAQPITSDLKVKRHPIIRWFFSLFWHR